MTVACVRFGEYRVEYREVRFEGEGFSTRFLFFLMLEEHELESLTLRERAKRSWQSRPVLVQQQQDFS